MNIAVYGASGFLGKNLLYYLSQETDWDLQAYARNSAKLADLSSIPSLIAKEVDVTNEQAVERSLKSVDVAYYFVHMMGHTGSDFLEAELMAARTFARAAKRAHLPKIIYMGGLGTDSSGLSKHLLGRHETGAILKQSGSVVIEFRASMIIGRGSVSFDILDNVVSKLPITPLPDFTDTLTQPIALQDAMAYLRLAAEPRYNASIVVEIGGPEKISYFELYKLFADLSHKKVIVLKIAHLPVFLTAIAFNLFTPKIHARIGRIMIDSMKNEMILHSQLAQKLFSQIKPMSLKTALQKNL